MSSYKRSAVINLDIIYISLSRPTSWDSKYFQYLHSFIETTGADSLLDVFIPDKYSFAPGVLVSGKSASVRGGGVVSFKRDVRPECPEKNPQNNREHLHARNVRTLVSQLLEANAAHFIWPPLIRFGHPSFIKRKNLWDPEDTKQLGE